MGERAADLGARIEHAIAGAKARAALLELDVQREASHRRQVRYLVAVVLVAGIILIGVVVARVRSPGPSTVTAPARRAPVTTTRPSATVPSPPSQPPIPVAPPAAPAPPPDPAPLVQQGDSLWTIAAAQVSGRLGRSASDGEITPFWFDLVRANAGTLRHPGNPDLVYPGQTVELPGE